MLKIKLTRIGKKNQPQYRIVVAEARSKRDGTFIDQLGYYNPLTNPSTFKIESDKYSHWLQKGAQPTPTIRQLVLKSTKKS